MTAGQVAKWPTATDCKSVLFGVRWFESILAHSDCCEPNAGDVDDWCYLAAGGADLNAEVAQLVERQPSKL
jgi:hypothetical protein